MILIDCGKKNPKKYMIEKAPFGAMSCFRPLVVLRRWTKKKIKRKSVKYKSRQETIELLILTSLLSIYFLLSWFKFFLLYLEAEVEKIARHH